MVAMAETRIRRIQHAEMIGRLISGISPEQGIRGIIHKGIQKKPASKRTFPHLIARSLFSVMLRAPSVSEAKPANESISILFRTQQEHDASALGFSPGHSTSFIANILIDMLSAAAQDEPLLQSGPTLSFYSEAGAGAADADEFHKATPERRVAQTHSHDSLSDIRQANLAKVIMIYADAFTHKDCRSKLLDVVRSNMHRILTPWLSILPSTISQLDSSLRESLFSFYSALVSALNDHERADIVTRLVSAIMQTIQTCPEHIFFFLDGLSNSAVKVSMCRLCLIQRFRVKDDCSKSLSAQTLVEKYLALKPFKGRANKAVPVLLTVLINAWLETSPQEKTTVRFLGKKIVKEIPDFVFSVCFRRKEIVNRYTEARDFDRIAFEMALVKLARKINSSERKDGERVGP
ncbi:hypothetical protein FGB62_4g255 [Gracilaria domingensis]|nr:hypothetical protein FGB62_4g255 [Gracilaria domingensis]